MARPRRSTLQPSLEERILRALRSVGRPLAATEFKLLPKLMGCKTTEIAAALANLVERREVVARGAAYELAQAATEGGGK
jgi:hypothetical protein